MPRSWRLAEGQFHLGLAAWAFAGWRGRYFPAHGPTLAAYSSVFGCVEGNTTFYSLPSAALVARWQQELEQRPGAREFHFCFKLPRAITHRRGQPDVRLLAEFFARLAPLEPWFGAFMVQLPASVGPADIVAVDALLALLPRRFRYVIEARHPELFSPPWAQVWLQMLAGQGCTRVILDSRPVAADRPAHPDIAAAVHAKPSLPVLPDAPGERVLVRLICHPLATQNAPFMHEWSARIAAWLAAGTHCHFMVHCPNDLHSPELARLFHELIAPLIGAPPLPAFPAGPASPRAQLSLDW